MCGVLTVEAGCAHSLVAVTLTLSGESWQRSSAQLGAGTDENCSPGPGNRNSSYVPLQSTSVFLSVLGHYLSERTFSLNASSGCERLMIERWTLTLSNRT